ncbi:MAG: ribose-phosphate pyrophosphokinase-like domain-containing protein, partial [Gammaproteobacteria bacterium]
MPLVAFNFGVADPFFSAVVSGLDATAGEHEQRYFPDGEAFVRFLTDCSNCHVVLISSLDAPSDKLLPLIIASATLRDLGAASVGLIAPYLAYMRQDKVFRSGEGVSARYFAKLLSNYFDWMTTVDPHLHRFASLNEVYDIPTAVAHAAPAIARWIQKSCPQAFLIGPDSESEQWVAEIARLASVPFITLKKVRTG